MLLIPAGPFEMGSTEDQGNPDEQPRHKVFVKDFYISLREVTVKAFCEFLNAQGETGKDGRPRLKLDAADSPVVKKGKRFQPKSGAELFPMVLVSWYGAVDFAEWAGGRLPSAAEWEKAAAYATPRSANDRPRAAKRDGPVPVKSAVPGVQGITGLVGNVWEWCSDWYAADYYSQSPPENPTGPETGQEKEIRGGSWASVEWSVRVQNRHKASPKGAYRTIGFRIVKD